MSWYRATRLSIFTEDGLRESAKSALHKITNWPTKDSYHRFWWRIFVTSENQGHRWHLQVCNEYINYIRKFKVRSILAFAGISVIKCEEKLRASEQNKKFSSVEFIIDENNPVSTNTEVFLADNKNEKVISLGTVIETHRSWIWSPASCRWCPHQHC